MAWRNQGITGSNNIPLGKRRFGDADPKEEDAAPQFNGGGGGSGGFADGPDRDMKRGRSPEPSEFPHHGLC